jgi:hypothetical protein
MSDRHTTGQVPIDNFTLQRVNGEIKLADRIEENTMQLAFYRSADRSASYYKLSNGIIDEYQDQTGINPGVSVNNSYDSTNHLWSPASGGIDSYSKLVVQNEDTFWLDKNAPFWNGTSQSLQVPDSADWAFGTSNLTIECFVWFYDPSVNSSLNILDQTQNGTDFQIFQATQITYAALYYSCRSAGGGSVINRYWYATYAWTPKTWYHVAIVRNGNNWNAYINGTQIDTTEVNSGSIIDLSAVVKIGEHVGNVYHKGYVREVRYSKSARYTGNFTVPTVPFVSDSNTLLLLHLNEAPGVTTFTDSSSYARTVTNNNTIAGNSVFYDSELTPKYITPVGGVGIIQTQFNSTAAFFDGSSSYIVVPDSPDWDFGSGDFTLEGWFLFQAMTSVRVLFDRGTGNDFQLNWDNSVSKFQFRISSYVYTASVVPITLNRWYHVAAVRLGGTVTMYVDGVSYGGGSLSGSISSSNPVRIGIDSAGNYAHQGFMKEVRFSNTARYVTGFTPSTSQFTADSYTKLLLHFDALPTATVLGPAIYFDGTGDYLTIPHSTDFQMGSGDFTVETWFKKGVDSSLIVLFGYGDWATLSGSNFNFYCTAANKVLFTFYYGGSGVDVLSTGTVTGTGWHHTAAVRYGNTITLYIDGVVAGTGNVTGLTMNSNNITMYLGSGAGSYTWNGYTREMRISKGIARYTAAFTPPTTPFAADANTSLLVHGNDVNGSDRGAYFNGTSSYLSVPDSTDWAFGTGAFTIEGWLNMATLPSSGNSYTILDQYQSSGNEQAVFFREASGNYYMRYVVDPSIFDNSFLIGAVSANTWNHFAIARDGNILRMYWNGVQCGTDWPFTGTVPDYSAALYIGSRNASTPYFSGIMKYLRISKGIARYRTNFNPPTSYVADTYTKLQLNFQENVAATTFVDSETTPKTVTTSTVVIKQIFWDAEITPKVITAFGDTKIKYAEDYRNTTFIDSEPTPKYPYAVGTAKIDWVAPFGTGACFYNGSTGYQTLADSDDWDFGTGDFTIELWFKSSSTGYIYFVSRTTANLHGFRQENASGAYTWNFNNSTGVVYVTNGQTYLNGWKHVAVARKGTITKVFENGIMLGSASDSNSYGTTEVLQIGFNYLWYMSGFIDNVRITKGLARYTDTFDPLLVDYTKYTNMSMQSVAFSASGTPLDARLVLYEEDIDSVTLNTDLKAYASRDNGTTWTQVALTNEGNYQSTRKVVAGISDISTQSSGSYNMLYKVQTFNNKGLKLYGAAMSWG